MPEHVLMSEIEIITDGGRRRRWTAAEKLRIVEETLDDQTIRRSRQHFHRCAAQWRCTQPGSYRWRRLMLEGGSVAVTEDDDVTSNKVVRQLEDRIRELERHLGRKTLEAEILREALDKSRSKKPTLHVRSPLTGGSR